MERLDFASVMAVLRRNIDEDFCTNQVELLEVLFRDMNEQLITCIEFDNGQVCKWMNGLARLSPKIIAHYREHSNQRKLACTIEERIIPMMPDSAMAVQELYDLLMQAPNVSQQMKARLTDGFSFDDENEEAVFITDVLCLAMQLHFEKRDIRTAELMVPGCLSPVVRDFIFGSGVPKPCRWFVGRESELKELHGLLMEHSKIFLRGIPGIGKSELAKMYAKLHSKEYTNILYMNYDGDLRQSIIDMDFSDDLPEETEEQRFRHHSRFLRSLREDTLLIVDNFNAAWEEDSQLDELLQYRCRILFTTRSRYEGQTTLELEELPADQLLELMGKFYDVDRKTDILQAIIEVLHGHTFAVELAARLLANSMLRPRALLRKLQKEKAAMDAEDKIGSTKDGRNRKATYYHHIHTLFSLNRLSGKEQAIMRCLIFVPENGVSVRQFGRWMDLRNLNRVNDLIDRGFVQPGDGRYISLHPMIREIAVEEMKPSVRNCKALLDGLHGESLIHGLEMPGYRQAFQTVENIIALIQNDDMPKYLRFLEDVFFYMAKYQYTQGMQTIIGELEALLADETVGTVVDRVLLLDCRASCVSDEREAIALYREALHLLGDVTPKTAWLASNLHSNLGALYFNFRDYDRARFHMEEGIHLLDANGLSQCHDCIMQINNYAALLMELGEPERSYEALQKLGRMLEVVTSNHSIDYAIVQQSMGNTCMSMGDVEQAKAHFQKAMEIYEVAYEDEPELLERKRAEIDGLPSPLGIIIQAMLSR